MTIGTGGLLLLAAGLMGGVILVIAATELLNSDSQTFKPVTRLYAVQRGESLANDWKAEAFEGARLVLRSRYLGGIAGIIGSYEIASQLMDYQFKLAAENISGVQATQAFITDVYLYASLLAVFTQFFLVGAVMRKFGLGVTLLVLPVAIIGGSLGVLAMPTLAVVSVLVILDNGLSYSVLQTGRESLYLATSPDEKYKGRAFISMFVQRVAKGLSILMVLLLGMTEVSTQHLSLLIIGILGVMVLLSIHAGHHYSHVINQVAASASAARHLASATPRMSGQSWAVNAS
jgi:AAA family ATP:ADP antiporter